MDLKEKLVKDKFLTDLEQFGLFRDYEVSASFIDQYADNLKWSIVLKYMSLPEYILEKYIDRVVDIRDKSMLSARYHLTEEFLIKHQDKIVWPIASTTQILSEDFIKAHVGLIDFAYLPYYQDISIDTLKALGKEPDVNWQALSWYALTNEFILEHFRYLDKHALKQNTKIELSDEVQLLIILDS